MGKNPLQSPCTANPSLASPGFKVQTRKFLQVSSSAANRLSHFPSLPLLVHFSCYLDQNYCSHTYKNTKTDVDAKSSRGQCGLQPSPTFWLSSLNRSRSCVESHAQRISLIEPLISLLTSSLLKASNPGWQAAIWTSNKRNKWAPTKNKTRQEKQAVGNTCTHVGQQDQISLFVLANQHHSFASALKDLSRAAW